MQVSSSSRCFDLVAAEGRVRRIRCICMGPFSPAEPTLGQAFDVWADFAPPAYCAKRSHIASPGGRVGDGSGPWAWL